MIKIKFNAFAFLKFKLKDMGISSPNPSMEIKKDIKISELVKNLGLSQDDVAVVFVNHKIVPKDTVLHDGDRVALIPPNGVPNHVKAYVGLTS
jgi:sulfur carrier protein ThiS